MPLVAAVQMVSGPVLEENFKLAAELLAEASRAGAELAVLPETFLTYGFRDKPDCGLQGQLLTELGALAKARGLWLVAGTLPLAEKNLLLPGAAVDNLKPYAASVVFDAEGRRVGDYLKMHLFDVDVDDATRRYRESDDYRAGSQVRVFDTPWGKLGVAVCYDLRFPELFVQMAGLGASIIAVPSAFTQTTGEAHWELLVRARAVDTQCFIVAANQGGRHCNGRETWGQSMIVGPWGEVLASQRKNNGVVLAELDMAAVAQRRQNMPLQQHRRI